MSQLALFEAGYMVLHTFGSGMKAGRTDVTISLGKNLGSAMYQLKIPDKLSNFPQFQALLVQINIANIKTELSL